MRSRPILPTLDAALALGAAAIPHKPAADQLRYVAAQQLPDGGYRGRRGDSDTYYTDFAVRILSLIPGGAPASSTAGYLQQLPEPADVVDCFNRLNIARLLGPDVLRMETGLPAIRSVLRRSRLPNGAYARQGCDQASAYNTFLGLLCMEMLNEDAEDACAAIAELRRADGGYGDTPGDTAGQTNPTAAALLVQMASDRADAPAIRFLASMQAPDGGFRAHADAPCGDLLSTFSVLTALILADRLDEIDLPAAARFIQRMKVPGGGFRSCAADPDPDIEYTWYGIGSVAILGAHVAQRRSKEYI